MKSVSYLPFFLLWISVIGQTLGNHAADFNNLRSLENVSSLPATSEGHTKDIDGLQSVSSLPATSEGHTKDIVGLQSTEGVEWKSHGMVLDFCPIPTVPYRAHEQVGFDKISSDISGHNSLQHITSTTESGVAEVPNATMSTIQNARSSGAKYLTMQPIEDLLAGISNVMKDCTAKLDVAEVLNAALSNIQNGFNSVKGLGAKCFVLDMSNISTIANWLMVALTVACVIVLMPRLSMQLLLFLAVRCLYLCFACRRCGELFRALRQRRDPNDIEQGDCGDPLPVDRLICDTVDLVYEDISRWQRRNLKQLYEAVDAHLLRFCSPQGELVRDPADVPDPAQHVADRPPEEADMVELPYQHARGPAMNYGEVHRARDPGETAVQGPALTTSDAPATTVVAEEPADGAEAVGVDDPSAALATTVVVEEPADAVEAVGVDAASDPSASPAAVEEPADGAEALEVDAASHPSAALATTAAVVAGALPFQELSSIDDVCSRIKKGLGPVYAQLPPFSPTYFRLQRVVECNMRSLATATRGLDWTKKIDLVVGMVTVVTVVQSNEDIDDILKNGVSLVRVEVPSGNEGGSGGKSRQIKEEGGKDRNGNRCLWRLLKKLLAPLTAVTPTLIAPPTEGSGSASEIGDARSPTEKSAATENRSDEWFVASVSELLKLDAAKVSFDALHRLLEFALWPWRQKMAFLFEVAGMIAVDSKSDGHAFLMALDRDLAERERLCVFQWRVELVVVRKDDEWTEEWTEKMFQWTQPSERSSGLDDEELGPYKEQVALLNTLWKEQKGGLRFETLPLRVLRAIRNLDAHKHEYPDYVLKQKMWRLVDSLFPSLFPFVAGAVMHKLSELHHRSASSLSKGERWFLMHGTGAWTDAQMSPSNDVKLLLNAVHQLGEARTPKCAVSPAENVE